MLRLLLSLCLLQCLLLLLNAQLHLPSIQVPPWIRQQMYSQKISKETAAFVYMHIAKTGGSSLNGNLPVALRLKNCNRLLNIATYSDQNPPSALQKLKGKFGKSCNFLTFELKRREMEPTMAKLGYAGHYFVLTSFREPLSHFISSYEHQSRAQWREPHTLNETADKLLNGSRYYYTLRNFQSAFLLKNAPVGETKHFNVTNSINYMKSTYWFSILENYRLSLALLQCQVRGKTDTALLDQVTAHSANSGVAKKRNSENNYEFDNEVLKKVKSLIGIDIYLYNQALVEFRRRVNIYSDCLKDEIELERDDIAKSYVAPDHYVVPWLKV